MAGLELGFGVGEDDFIGTAGGHRHRQRDVLVGFTPRGRPGAVRFHAPHIEQVLEAAAANVGGVRCCGLEVGSEDRVGDERIALAELGDHHAEFGGGLAELEDLRNPAPPDLAGGLIAYRLSHITDGYLEDYLA